MVLRSLKADAEEFLGEPVTEAVITVPAYFNDKQRKATRRAGELAGFKVERLLNEPAAAALAYGIHELGNDTRFLVFDLGGGTFDVSVLDIFDGIIEVRSSTGDNRLGGDDFNQILVDDAIAIGAAVQAGLKARDAALKDVVMTDVCPYTLGVDTGEQRADGSLQEGIFAPIIERNSVVPASREKRFSTLQDNQREVVFNVYQGESRRVADNVHLGVIGLAVPPRPRGAVTIDVRFTYDINGLLEVDVKSPETGETRQLVVVDAEIDMASEEMKRRHDELAALKIPPRDTALNRAALARAARCYEQFVGDKRAQIGRLTGHFEAVLDRQDPREIEIAREEFMKALDEIDGERYL